MRQIDVKTECANLAVNFLVCTRKPWLAAISHPKASTVLSHGLSRLASRKDCKPAVRDSKPRLWSLILTYGSAQYRPTTCANACLSYSLLNILS